MRLPTPLHRTPWQFEQVLTRLIDRLIGLERYGEVTQLLGTISRHGHDADIPGLTVRQLQRQTRRPIGARVPASDHRLAGLKAVAAFAYQYDEGRLDYQLWLANLTRATGDVEAAYYLYRDALRRHPASPFLLQQVRELRREMKTAAA